MTTTNNEQLYTLATEYCGYVGPMPTYKESAAAIYLEDLLALEGAREPVDHIQFLSSPLMGRSVDSGMIAISRNLRRNTSTPTSQFAMGIGTRAVDCPADLMSEDDEEARGCPIAAMQAAASWAEDYYEEHGVRTVEVEWTEMYCRWNTVELVVDSPTDTYLEAWELRKTAVRNGYATIDFDALDKMGIYVDDRYDGTAETHFTELKEFDNGDRLIGVYYQEFFSRLMEDPYGYQRDGMFATFEADPQDEGYMLIAYARTATDDAMDDAVLDKMGLELYQAPEDDYSITDVKTGKDWEAYQAANVTLQPKYKIK
jgi:hypothetical protein